MNPKELAWAAGFYDGEGCTAVCRGPDGGVGLNMSIPQTDRRPLDRFLTAIECGTVTGPRVSKNPNAKLQWVWKAGAWRDVQAAVAKLWNYLSAPKKEQAIRKFAEYRSRPQWSRTESILKGKPRNKRCHVGHENYAKPSFSKKGVMFRYCKTCRKMKYDSARDRRALLMAQEAV